LFSKHPSLEEPIGSSCVGCKTENGADKTEFHDGANVTEEFLAAHIVAGWEDNEGQDEVEENIRLELEVFHYQISLVEVLDHNVDQETHSHAEDDDDASGVPHARLKFLNEAFNDEEKGEEAQDQEVEDLLNLLVFH
jgi:hypothetical protein